MHNYECYPGENRGPKVIGDEIWHGRAWHGRVGYGIARHSAVFLAFSVALIARQTMLDLSD